MYSLDQRCAFCMYLHFKKACSFCPFILIALCFPVILFCCVSICLGQNLFIKTILDPNRFYNKGGIPDIT